MIEEQRPLATVKTWQLPWCTWSSNQTYLNRILEVRVKLTLFRELIPKGFSFRSPPTEVHIRVFDIKSRMSVFEITFHSLERVNIAMLIHGGEECNSPAVAESRLESYCLKTPNPEAFRWRVAKLYKKSDVSCILLSTEKWECRSGTRYSIRVADTTYCTSISIYSEKIRAELQERDLNVACWRVTLKSYLKPDWPTDSNYVLYALWVMVMGFTRVHCWAISPELFKS